MPDIYLDVDTALAEVPVNLMPLIDDTDFKTRETAVAYNASGMDLVWNFVTSAGAFTQTAVTPTTAGSYDWTHQGDAMYTIKIPASGGASINNDTEGYGWFIGVATGVLPWRGPIIGFRAAALNDALIDGGDNLDVNVTQFGGTNATTSGGRPEVNASHAAGTAWNSGAITANTLAADAITAAKVAADVGTEIATAVWGAGTRQLTGAQTFDLTGNITGNIAGSVGSVTGNVGGNVAGSVGSVAAGGITASSIAADAIGASELAADAVAEIAGAVWDITLASHLTGGTTGNALNAAGSAGDPWSTALPGAYSAGSAGYIMGTNLNATVSSRLASASYTAPLDAAGTRSAVGLASANLDTQLDALPTATENADALLKRDWSSVTGEAARSVLNALRFLRNRWTLSGGTVTVYKEDDATTAWSGSATTAASDPVSSIDPS